MTLMLTIFILQLYDAFTRISYEKVFPLQLKPLRTILCPSNVSKQKLVSNLRISQKSAKVPTSWNYCTCILKTYAVPSSKNCIFYVNETEKLIYWQNDLAILKYKKASSSS